MTSSSLQLSNATLGSGNPGGVAPSPGNPSERQIVTIPTPNPSLAGVVILVPQHLRFLPRLVANLNESSPAFDELIVVASGFRLSQRRIVQKILKTLHAEHAVIFSRLGSAGRNRNLGSKRATAELVSFLDADDIYAPDRNSVIKATYSEENWDIFLHSFVPFDEVWEIEGKLNSRSSEGAILVDEKDLLESTFPGGRRDRANELSGRAPTTNLVSKALHPQFPTHHAHVTASRKILETTQFHEVFGMRNEDGIFARDVLQAGGHVVVSSLVLSGYQQGARAKPRQRPTVQSFMKSAVRKVLG